MNTINNAVTDTTNTDTATTTNGRLATVLEFVKEHKQVAAAAGVGAGVVGAAWGVTAFIGNRKAKAAQAQAELAMKLDTHVGNINAKRAVLASLATSEFPGASSIKEKLQAEIGAWDNAQVATLAKRASGTLTQADIDALTGIAAASK